MQENTCLISGNCYDDGEVNPENSFEICDAMRNTTAWIDITPTGSTAAGSTAVGSTAAGSTAAGITPTTITSAFAPGEFFLFYIKSSLMITII